MTAKEREEIIDLIKNGQANQRKKGSIEFSKIMFLFVAVINLAVIVFTCVMIERTNDLSPLSWLIPSVGGEMAVGTGFYYAKAKVENRLKLLAAFKLKPTRSDLEA